MVNQNFDIDLYCRKLQENLLSKFGERLCYVGLQGSYLRGEATEKSDIDIMVIFDTLTVDDMNLYREIIEEIGFSDRACGFICSKADMKSWNPLEACQLVYTTKDLYGSLSDFIPQWSEQDEVNYIKMSLNNLYHALCHGYIHADRTEFEAQLLPFYKSAFFILQNTHYLETLRSGVPEFILCKAELLPKLQGQDKAVLKALIGLTDGNESDFEKHYSLLFSWCQNKMAEVL